MRGDARGLAAVVACIALVASASCDQPIDPIARQPQRLQVTAVLDLGFVNQFVLVEWSQPNANTVPIFNGSVIVTMPNGQSVIASQPTQQGPAGSYFKLVFDTLGLQLRPGDKYTLTAAVGGTEVTGSTVVPSVPSIAIDTQTQPTVFTRATDTIRLSWPRVPGAAHYQVSIVTQFRGPPGNNNVTEHVYSFFADTSVMLPGRGNEPFFDNPLFYPNTLTFVMVHAVDENYYTYFHASTDPFAGAPPSRLKGGIGVFGSMVPMVIKRYSVR